MTAWRRLSLTLLVALCCHTGASAETLPVYDDETSNSQYVPVYGFGADAQGTTSEFVIPKEQLVAMEDGTISALTFSLQQSAAAAWTATIQVYLKEISATTLTGIVGHDANDVVYTGTLDARGTEMTVTFSTPYTYNGGNLLIGTYISVAGNYNQAIFYGASQSVNTACYKKGSTTTLLQFIPKTTFTYDPSGTVPKPNNLAASNITYEKATITWASDQSAWDIAWSTDPNFNPASVSTRAENVSVKTYTITGLSQFTDYYVAVQNAGSGKWSQKLQFKTTAKSATDVGNGWSDDFEGTNCGWKLINGELTNKWAWGTAANNGGTHALYISNDGGTTNAYSHSETMVYAAMLFNFTEGKFKFSYDWKANGESSFDYLRVALIPGTASLTADTSVPSGFNYLALPTGWIALDGGNILNGVEEWKHKDETIDVAAGNYYLVFAWRNDGGGGNNPPAAIDNVSITKYPDEITNLAVSDITATTATVSWNGNSDSYNVRYKEVILSEGFEGGSMPTGWTTDGPGTWLVGTGDDSESTGSHSGGKNALIKHTTKNNVTYLITPSMDLSEETSLTLSFWYINRASAGSIDDIGVYYRVANGTWTELWSATEAHESWTNQEVTLTGLAADYQLGFKMTDYWGYGVGLDDIQIASSADWQTVNITTKSTTLTGLDANTTYGCQVQGVNAGLTSLWSPIATFITAAKVTLTDGEDLSALSAYAGQAVAVTYSRSFTSGKTSTVCLPFAYTKKAGDGSFYAFTNIEKVGDYYVATMTESGESSLAANTPYLFTPAATGDVTFTGTIASVPATFTAGETVKTDWTFKGTFSTIEWTTAPAGTYGFSAKAVGSIVQGEFVKVGEYVRIKPMRCYLKYTGSDAVWAAARGMNRAASAAEQLPETIKVRLISANGEVTGIGTLQTKTGEVTMDNEAWYSLDGRRIVGKPSAKGIYVNNGKIVNIK